MHFIGEDEKGSTGHAFGYETVRLADKPFSQAARKMDRRRTGPLPDLSALTRHKISGPALRSKLLELPDFSQSAASTNYNESIGEALGIEGAEQAGPDYATLQPNISATINDTRVDVGWDWGGFANFLDQIEIQVDRGGATGFIPLVFDTTPGYVDTQPFPAAPVKRTYQAIYRVGDNRVGQWSKPVTVTVGA